MTIISTPRQLILQRLIEHGIPEEVVNSSMSGLVAFVKDNKRVKSELVSVILSSDEDMLDAAVSLRLKDMFRESMVWLQWIMFEGDPMEVLTILADMSDGHRGVCGVVWGSDDIAYKCLTCQLDPTCAICVTCFLNGNHEGHDYSTIYTGGGCCDCGDATAWKREGFCVNHKGADEIQPLPDQYARIMEPVFNALLIYWKNKLTSHPRANGESDPRKIVSELSYAIVEMLLEFCRYSESLLSFVSKQVYSFGGLLDILVRAERQLTNESAKKLHELLLKLLGEPVFKYEFAKAFISYYPTVIAKGVRRSSDSVYEKYPLISTFSVQILTVPILTPFLVKEMNLLDMLVGCLEEIFVSCAGKDGCIELAKLNNMYENTLHVIDDIRFVLSHDDVPKHIVIERRYILSTWVRLLGFMQGMDPQKREIGIHVEDESEHTHLPFILDHYIARIHSLLVNGAYIEDISEDKVWHACELELNDEESLRHAKVGRVSHVSSVSSATGRSIIVPRPSMAGQASDCAVSQLSVPTSFVWLASECIKAIDNWLEVENEKKSKDPLNVLSPTSEHASGSNSVSFRRTLTTFRRHFIGLNEPSTRNSLSFLGSNFRNQGTESMLYEKLLPEGSYSQKECGVEATSENIMELESAADSGSLCFLRSTKWPYLQYDVSSENISLHIPLHRLLSLIFHKGLSQWFGESVMTTFISNDPLLDATYFFGKFLGNCHPCGFSAFVMEQPLRIRVFCAQVHAGMWKRNGDAAIVSCELYRTTRWSEQSIELDLFLLQCCAALAPADLFVDRIAERFGLSDYLSFSLERLTENEHVLVQEMLTLLIQIVTERRFCGMTKLECLKRELIQKLSIGDATRSQLVKSLPRDLCKSNQIQEVLDDIASYSNPSGLKQGMYSLGPSFWKELDLYHPRWNLKDLQVAEERHLRICNVSALTTRVPRWTKIYHPLSEVAKIAISKAVLQIVRAVLYYAVFTELTESRAPDNVLLSALHLLALALDICAQYKKSYNPTGLIPLLASSSEIIACEASKTFGEHSLLSLLVLLMRTRKRDNSASVMEAGNYDISSFISSLLKKFCELETECMPSLRKLAPEFVDQFFHHENKDTDMPITAGNIDRKMKSRDRQAAILAKMKADQSKFLASIDVSESDELTNLSGKISDDACEDIAAKESAYDICSLCHDQASKTPVSFLVHLQKSRLVSVADSGQRSWTCRQTDKSNALASTCQQLKRTSRSTSRLNVISELLQSQQGSRVDFSMDGQMWDARYIECLRSQIPLKEGSLPVHFFMNDYVSSSEMLEKWEESMYTSIWEQVHDQLKNAKLIDARRSLHSDADHKTEYIEASISDKHIVGPSDEGAEDDNYLAERDCLSMYNDFGPLDCDGVFMSSCGHAVHQGCLDQYLSSLRERRSRRIAFEGGHIVDLDQGEFLCPVCRLLANCVLSSLPADPPVTSVSSDTNNAPVECSLLGIRKALYILETTSGMIDNRRMLETLLTKKNGSEKTNVQPLLQALYSMYIPEKRNLSSALEEPHSSIMWDTIKYSLMSVEIAARTGKSSLIPNYSLDSLYGELKSSGELVFPLLAKIVDTRRGGDPRKTFLRFRGIQHFAKSISMDHPVEAFSQSGQNYDNFGAGRHSKFVLPYYDMRFWERASDPIIAHDPFSSLMWTLFCLPKPFLVCKETFTSLVHLFYTVCITQAIATYHWKFQDSASDPSLKDSMIGDIVKFVGGSRVSRQYFLSSYVYDMSSIHDGIRRMCFPFLRRCTLLSKVLCTLTSGSQQNKSFHTYDDMTMITSNDPEFAEIRKLEHMHQIPSLDDVLKDRYVRSLALLWLDHFETQFKDCHFPHSLHLTPAVPFKLMHLPHVYQDLLQSCIKQQCSGCKSPIENPALCLFCGKLCSPVWKPCCNENGCEKHAADCGAGTGVYLLIRKTTILLQRCARKAIWPSPYLDAFGEEDADMRRGKPLYLNEERYAALCYMVASHGLDRNSKVLHQTSVDCFAAAGASMYKDTAKIYKLQTDYCPVKFWRKAVTSM